jgi:hypothetical protein
VYCLCEQRGKVSYRRQLALVRYGHSHFGGLEKNKVRVVKCDMSVLEQSEGETPAVTDGLTQQTQAPRHDEHTQKV